MNWRGTGNGGPGYGRVRGLMGRILGVVALLALLIVPSFVVPSGVRAAGWENAGTLPGDYSLSPQVVLLADGRVLAAAKADSAVSSRGDNSWTAITPRKYDVGGGRLLALQDGSALLIGGSPSTFANNPYAPTRQVVRFDPSTATWITKKDMPDSRGGHTLTTLGDGTVLVVGGSGGSLSPRQPVETVAKVARYDPATDSWSALAPLAQGRYGHSATLLADGRVLVVGGAFSKTVNSENVGSEALNSAELYNPATNTWQTVAPLSRTRSGHKATLLLDGTVLIIGGDSGTGSTTAERYNPQTNTWTSAATLGAYRVGFAATQLLGGDVLVTGGAGTDQKPLATAMRYDWQNNSWQPFASLATPRVYHGAILVNGQVLAIGGLGTAAQSTAERYDVTPVGTVCYEDTGRCLGGTFLAYWQGHGQLPINGYPLSNPFPEQLEDGKIYLVQYFERVRMEAHPEKPAPFDILLGQFGRRIHPADPGVSPQTGARYFELTGHNLSGGFLTYWDANGGVTQFGYPLSEVITETLEDGKPYQVQYFERARFEYHPENAAPYDVLLGQFGRKILAGR